MMWGNLFQQLYNIIDSLVVGNFVGMQALAAITSTGSLTFLLVGFFGGIFTGCGVVISRYFGAGDSKTVHKAIHTSIGFALVAGVVLTLIGTLLTPQILRLMKTPDDVFDLACTYIRIFFGGILSVVLYNTAAGIFQAVGDSKHPLYYLIVSSVTNVVLDILFVTIIDLGVAGVAIATIISQFLSVILAFRKLMKIDDIQKVVLKDICIDKKLLKEEIRIGLPSGIQNSVIAIANVIVQGNVNVFGAAAAAGYGAAAKIEGMVFIPITSLAMAMTTFVSQNLGARKLDRVKKGAKFGLLCGGTLSELIGVATFFLAPQLIALFTNDPSAIAAGALKNRICGFFCFMLSVSHIYAGIMRGAGKSKVPMFVMLGSWCVIRVTYITIITIFIKEISVVFWAYPLTWCISALAFTIYYKKSNWLRIYQD